jgi:hypothetical protein
MNVVVVIVLALVALVGVVVYYYTRTPEKGPSEGPSPNPQDCVVSWSDWGACDDTTGTRTRKMVVETPAADGGKACPDPLSQETEYCPVDCVTEWGPWGPCDDGTRRREHRIVVRPLNGGEACNVQAEAEDCPVDCVAEWGPWGPCDDGTRRREPMIVVRPLNGGKACPPEETEPCRTFRVRVHRPNWGDNEIIFFSNERLLGSDIIEFEDYVRSFGEQGVRVIEAESGTEMWFRSGRSYDETRQWWRSVHRWVAMTRGKRLNLNNDTWYEFVTLPADH